MSLVVCPECGGKISIKAKFCTKCGFEGDKPNLPISQQFDCEVIPQFEVTLNKWNSNHEYLLSEKNHKELFEVFGRWEKIQILIPDIANVIKDMANSEQILVAEMDGYIRRLIEQGIYHFNIDKHGKLLPTISDTTGIVKQVRLKELTLSQDLTQSLNVFSTHIALNKLIDDVQEIKKSINSLHIELQNDRLAQADAAWNEFEQAINTQNVELRRERINSSIATAIKAKNLLMKNFSQSLQDFNEKKIPLGKEQIAEEAFQTLSGIINMVQIECKGNALLEEYEACRKSLQRFQTFVANNKLTNYDIILNLNENVKISKQVFVDDFKQLVVRLERLVSVQNLDDSLERLFLMDSGNEKDNSAKFCKKCKRELQSTNNSGYCEFCKREREKPVVAVLGKLGVAGSFVAAHPKLRKGAVKLAKKTWNIVFK